MTDARLRLHGIRTPSIYGAPIYRGNRAPRTHIYRYFKETILSYYSGNKKLKWVKPFHQCTTTLRQTEHFKPNWY